jgi:hypothetical protein
MEFLAHFDYDITYVKGEMNLVADALSRYYESDNWDAPVDKAQYVNADAQLDPEGEDLPWDQFEESCTMHESGEEHRTHPQCIQQAPQCADEPISFMPKQPMVKAAKPRQLEAANLIINQEGVQESSVPKQTLLPHDHADPMVGKSLGYLPVLHPHFEGDCSILKEIGTGYTLDLLYLKVLENIDHHQSFEIIDGLLYTHNRAGTSVLCIPSVILNKQQLTEVIIAQAHEVLGHFGLQKTMDYICCHYWWSHIGQDIEQYCKTCPVCQMTKISTQRIPGLLHSLPIPAHP